MKRARTRWLVASGVAAVLVVAMGAFLFSRRGSAQVQLVTVPGRDTVELTIYNSRDLTFAKEQRNITLRQGTNLIQFSWAGTRIDPTSVQLASVGDASDVRVLEAIIPKNLENAILWRVDSTSAGPHVVEVSYFIQGLTWRADYMAFVNSQETALRLLGNFMVSNQSGEDYAGVQSRLVVGDIRMISEDQLRALSQGVRDAARAPAMREKASMRYAGRRLAMADRVGQGQSLSEYYMFTIQGENTIDNGWSKKITAFDAANVPVSVVYQYDPGPGIVRRLYTFVNDEEHGLGAEPLPTGSVRVFMVDEQGQVSFIGQNQIGFTPVSKEIKLDLGPELAVEVERELLDYAKENLAFNDDGDVSRFDTEEEYRIEARNYRPEHITLEIPEFIGGQWKMLRSSHPYEQKDVNTIQFTLELDAGQTDVITYRVRHLGR